KTPSLRVPAPCQRAPGRRRHPPRIGRHVMADALTVELVAADRMVWSGEATMVIARTVEGDIGVLRGHAPVLSLLTEAIVEITAEDGHTVFAVADGGFLSVANDRVSILSE